jgi:hypothetical protein
MSEATTVEKRLTALESELADLKRQVTFAQASGSWFTNVAGSFKNEPEFEEVLRLGREMRQLNQADT